MAIVAFDQIQAIINAGRPDWIKQAETEHIRLNVHINGKDTDKYLTVIDTIENKKQLFLRQKFLTTNKHYFANLIRPVDKVFSAKGGGRIYNLNTDNKEKKLRERLNNVRHGKTINQWIKDIQANKYYTDPAGLVFFEWKDTTTYPTIKSIKSIQNYQSNGRTLEWVLFNPEKEVVDGKETGNKLYRFVDDSFDYLIKESNGNYTILEEQTFKNPFGKVPAIINSNIINSDLTYNESPFEVVVSLADHYLRTGSIKNLVEFLHGYPIFWRYLTDCPHCKGTGYIGGDPCSYCSGTGKNLNKDVTDIIQVERPKGDEQKLAPDLAGYVAPEIVGWQEMRVEQESIMSLSELTMWGSKMAKDTTNETATAAFINVQPVNDRLNGFSDAFEDMEKKMTDLIGIYHKLYSGDDGSSINYGRRYLVESPDVVWQKYQDAKNNGSPKSTLNYLLLQFYQSEFTNDIENLSISQKSIYLEPFIHKTDEEINDLPIHDDDKKAKFYFNEWFKSISTIELLSKDIKQLEKEFKEFLTNKELQNDTNV
jgi:hypothetical protein